MKPHFAFRISHFAFLVCVLVLLTSCTQEGKIITEGHEPTSPVVGFGSVNECSVVNDTALIVATSLAYFHDGLINDGIDSFFSRHTRFIGMQWTDTVNASLVISRISFVFQIDSQIIVDYFDVLENYRLYLS